MRVLVAGASGFVGSRLCPRLAEAGHEVKAMTRHPDSYTGAGDAVFGDVHDPGSLSSALAGADAAYYLVHSLDAPDFVRRDAAAATAFARAAAAAGVTRIVYLGGLGDEGDDLSAHLRSRRCDDLSAHLRSRREVERLLGATGVATTVLRAGIVIGHGGISWELMRQLVSHLPAMVTPRWVRTRSQPIAVRDVVTYLAGVLTAPAAAEQVYDVGGPDVLRYDEMLQRVARLTSRRLVVVPVPPLTPRLSSYWLALVTDVDVATGRALVDSMTNEVVVRDRAIERVVPTPLACFDDAVREALAERGRGRRAGRPR